MSTSNMTQEINKPAPRLRKKSQKSFTYLTKFFIRHFYSKASTHKEPRLHLGRHSTRRHHEYESKTMLGKKSPSDQSISNCLKSHYNIEVAKLIFLPLGADINASIYKARLVRTHLAHCRSQTYWSLHRYFQSILLPKISPEAKCHHLGKRP